MSKELKFKNHSVDYTYDGVDWTGVEQETIQQLAWAYAKTAPLDAYCKGKSGHLGVIRMDEALTMKVDRVTVTAQVTKLRTVIDRLKSGELTIADAIAQGLV